MKGFLDTITSQVTDPIKWRRLNGFLVIFWMAMFVFSIVFNLLSVVAFISVLSIYANWATHLGVWAASRAEAKQVEVEETENVEVESASHVDVNNNAA